jgi:hypothetical protein
MSSEASIDLYWIPLGAGARSVRLNGWLYEAVQAVLGHRRPLALYHAALEVHDRDDRFVIEVAPIPDGPSAERGVVAEGSVGSRVVGRFRVFRYELRRWRTGAIPDVVEAVASPQRLSDDPVYARRLLDLVPSVPTYVWGRDELGAGEMWTSNSVISWLIARSGLPAETLSPPPGGRAPGWQAGLVSARRGRAASASSSHQGIGEEETMKTIVVGYEETEPAKRALARAAEPATALGAKVMITSVAPVDGRGFGPVDPVDQPELHREEFRHADAFLAGLGLAPGRPGERHPAPRRRTGGGPRRRIAGAAPGRAPAGAQRERVGPAQGALRRPDRPLGP